MQPLSGIKSAKVWLPPVSSSIKIPPFTVHHRSKSQTDVITHEIQIVHDNAEVRTVIIVEPEVEIQCSGSSVDTSQIRSLVSTVLYLETKQPITILSSDGASLCGLFVAVHSVIQQMNMDDRVDVFTAVRQLQIRRPELCARFQHPWPDKSRDFGSENAVDGLYSDRGEYVGQCTISDDGRYTATWRVDLGRVVSISHIDIYYRKDYQRMHFSLIF
eukprot:XP_019928898.1 PREDICTED: uncharacterized protein LOC105343469 [Crassostrea gigas]